MKSQAYASKRRLTNICCLLVGLGLVKLVFGVYLMTGGELFTFNQKAQVVDPKMEALAKVRQKQLLAMKKMEQQVTEQSSSKKEQEVIVPQKAEQKTQIAENSYLIADASYAQAPKQKNVPQLMENVDNGTTADILVKASTATIGAMRTKARHSVLETPVVKHSLPKEESQHILDGVESKPSYKPENKSLFNFVGTAHAEEVDPSNYQRPDQSYVNQAIPAPTINNPYNSPKVLSYKEAELNQKEEELLALQEQMNSRMEELNKLENKLGDMVKQANAVEGEKYTHLIQTYAAMKPKNAAAALATLDEKIAVRILTGMKSKQSGEIFSYMDPVQAARLSSAMTKISSF